MARRGRIQGWTGGQKAGERPAALTRAITQEIHAVDPNVLVYNVRTMRDRLYDSLARQRFAATMLGAFAVFALLLAACVTGPVALRAGRYGRALGASALATVSVIALAAEGLFPRLVPTRPDLAASLTVYNASSTPYTLRVMLVIALIGMPFVIAYTAIIYRAFRGKTVLTSESY